MAEQKFHTEITASATQFNAEMEAAAQKMLTDGQRMQSGWREGFVQMGQAGGSMVKQLNGQFDAVRETIKSIRGPLAAIGVIIGGAAFLNKFAADSAKASKETENLAKVLGITTQEASALQAALDDIGSDTETYTGAVSKLTTGLRENEKRFNELGVGTRATNGNLLSTDQIMQNAFKALLKFREGTDRNLASSELFGKSWQEVNKLMKLTPEAMEAARVKAYQLQTQVGPEGAASAERYRMAMNDVSQVWEAMKNRVGQALMPALTTLGEWLASIGPAAIDVTRTAVGTLVAIWHGLANAVTIVWKLVRAFLFNVTEPMVGFGEAIGLALGGNLVAAGARLRQITPNVKAAWEDSFREIVKSSEQTKKDLIKLFSFDSEQGSGDGGAKGGSNKYSGPPKPPGPSRMSAFEAELAAQRDAYDKQQLEQGSFQEFSKEMERAYWKKILDMGGLSREEQASVSKKYYTAEREIRKQSFELQIADLKARQDAERKGSDERIALAAETARLVGEKYGRESKEYRESLAAHSAMLRERAEQERRFEELAIESQRNYQIGRLELERANLDHLETLGVIKAGEKIALLRELKNVEFQIELQAAEARAEIIANDVVAYHQALEKIAELRRKHAVEMKQFDNKEAADRKKEISKWLDPIGDAVQTMVNGLLQGTQRVSDIFRNMMRNLLAQFISTLIKMGLEWVKTEILKTTATTTGVAARTAAEGAGAAATTASTATTATTTIGAKAWEAASSVYASIAQIPYVGPFLAPAMAIAAAATVLGFVGKIASASGGFDIPSGINPVTQLHQEEMVLPADLANRVRGMTDGGGSGGTTIHVHAMDSQDVRRSLQKGGALRRELHRVYRTNAIPG